VSYEWDWESDGTYDATGVTASHAFVDAGLHTVTLRVTDDFIPGNTATTTVMVEVTARPVITSFVINADALSTQTLPVTLTIAATDAAQMRFRNDGGAWSAWMPYATSAPWVLAAGPEGWRKVDAQCISDIGIGSFAVSDLIFYDTTDVAPWGKVVIEGGAAYTESLEVTLDLYATGATQMRLKNLYADAWGEWQPYARTTQWTLAAGEEGARAVYVQYRDMYGALSAPRADTLCYDTAEAPVGRVLINGGAQETATRSVTLNLRARAAAEMRFKQRYADAWGAWQPYAVTAPATLTPGDDGPRAVYAQFRDYLGTQSAAVCDTIYLETEAPPVGLIRINRGAELTLQRSVTLNIWARGATEMRFKHRYADAWEAWRPYATSVAWMLLEGADGERAVYAQFRDRLGNMSDAVCDTILYDSFAPPELKYFRINDNAERTASREVTLSIGASGAAQMRFKNRPDDPWSAWQPYATRAQWLLALGADGERTVYAQCRDYLGCLSQVQADTIILER